MCIYMSYQHDSLWLQFFFFLAIANLQQAIILHLHLLLECLIIFIYIHISMEKIAGDAQ